jgi:hypothetical protein
MAAKKQQTFAKRARELAVKEKRERKQAKKAARAAGLEIVDGEIVDPDAVGGEGVGDGALAPEPSEAAATHSAQDSG